MSGWYQREFEKDCWYGAVDPPRWNPIWSRIQYDPWEAVWLGWLHDEAVEHFRQLSEKLEVEYENRRAARTE